MDRYLSGLAYAAGGVLIDVCASQRKMRGGLAFPRGLREPASTVLLGCLLVGCAMSAPDPKKPGDEALTCPQIQDEIEAQDTAARREAAKFRSLEPGASAYTTAEQWIPYIGSLMWLADLPTDASGARAMAHAGSAAMTP
jgi:hypothetical protein